MNEKNVVVAEIGASEGGDGQLKLFDRVHKQTVGISAGVRVGEHSDQAVVTINGMLMVRDGSAFTSLSGSDMQICKEPSDSELAHLRDNGLALRRVHLGIFDDYSGGFVQVLNPPGKIVAEMQCSKANAGFIAANDFDGDVKQSLSGAR
ncbi:MAG TPA: hypothetical protein VFI31_14900 [Pirellulales bacterium]|nr:hypothetical protein [Pirellulales bacterium]